jgi:hypothetical protein
MPVNPSTSVWNKINATWVQDQQLAWRWMSIKHHMTRYHNIREYKGQLVINNLVFLAKHSSKMRLKSHLDWSWYTPKTLAQALDNNTIEQYYEIMLKDIRSDPNQWNDKQLEAELKSYYAARAGRASLI